MLNKNEIISRFRRYISANEMIEFKLDNKIEIKTINQSEWKLKQENRNEIEAKFK